MPVKSEAAKLHESFVLYFSSEDGRWIAHGLRTDQVGTGEDLVEALADGMKAVRDLLALAAEDPTIAVLRDAPREIQEMRHRSKRLPDEIFEIAHKKVHGEWPFETQVRPTEDGESFSAEAMELSCAE